MQKPLHEMTMEEVNAVYEKRREEGATEEELMAINSHALDCAIESGEVCFADVGFPGTVTGGGKNSELHALNMKINHVAKMLEIGGTKAHVPRDLTEIEKDKRTLNGLPEERELTEYEMFLR